jgi:hypothetical protein
MRRHENAFHSGAPVSVFVAFKRNAYVVTEGSDNQIQFAARQGDGDFALSADRR